MLLPTFSMVQWCRVKLRSTAEFGPRVTRGSNSSQVAGRWASSFANRVEPELQLDTSNRWAGLAGAGAGERYGGLIKHF